MPRRAKRGEGPGTLAGPGPCRRASTLAAAVVLGWLKEAMTVDMQQEEGPHLSMEAADLLSRLTSQRDKENGSTPLHLAASLRALPSALYFPEGSWKVSGRSATKLLLDANVSAVYLPDNEGLYPIHVAASAGCLRTVMALLERCPDCATLRDAKGRTFLHAAAEKGRWSVVQYVCNPSKLRWSNPMYVCRRLSRPAALSSILNVQDNNGDTALHRAIQAVQLGVFYCLIGNPKVRLDITNEEGMRAIDLSWSMMPSKAYYAWDYKMLMVRSLLIVGPTYGESRGDLFDEKRVASKEDADKMSEDLTNAAQVMAIFSVLITTVTFAAAFTLPGGYRSAGDGGVAGTPVLAGSYTFDVFILSNGLAFVCSFFATSLLLYAGVPAGSLDGRFGCINAAYTFMMNSGRSLVVALGFGLYVVLLPVARTIPVAIAIAMVVLAIALVKGSEGINSVLPTPIIGKRRPPSRWDAVLSWIVFVFEHFWSYMLIFGIPAIRKLARAR